jgi:hypothetical protein
LNCSIFSDGEYYFDCQRRLATSENLENTSGNIQSTANVKGDVMPLFLLLCSPIYTVRSRLKPAR